MPKLSELGEKKMVELLLAKIGPSGGIGLGDDAAAVPIGDRYLVVSTDLIAQRTHMPPSMTSRQKGWMAAAVNLSDIAAMGATPLGLVVAYGLPRDLRSEDLLDMAEGVRDCCEECSCDYLGGDTKEAGEVTIVGTSLGLVRRDGILRRTGAGPGDLLGITSGLGLASAGFLEIMDDDHDAGARKAALQPRPRVKEGVLLSASGAVTSCMDTSDGLALSVHELAKASSVGFSIDVEKLPVDRTAAAIALRRGKDPTDLAIYGSGDYGLLFTVAPDSVDRLKRIMGSDVAIIGEATEERRNVLRQGGKEGPLLNKGYEHFKS